MSAINYIQTDGQTGGKTNRQIDRQTDEQTGGQTDGQPHGQTDRQTGRQTNMVSWTSLLMLNQNIYFIGLEIYPKMHSK